MSGSVSFSVILQILGMAGSQVLLHWQERMALKGKGSDANEGHIHLLPVRYSTGCYMV